MTGVKEYAYAKINLFLDVVGKREDGFHDIRTVMHSVTLCDEVTVTRENAEGGNIKIRLEGNKRLPTDGKNLVFSAARLFLDTASIRTNVSIKLLKRIPVAAGLAGGSSDAAATLRALNKLFGRPFTDKMLEKLAANLGSDVPYCLRGATALCEGRGEKITRLANPSLHTVIAIARERVSTPTAYSELDRIYSDFDGTVSTGGDGYLKPLMNGLTEGKVPDSLFNIFENAILPTCEGASAIKKKMLDLGATVSLMSGSGPSVFGVFDTEEGAVLAKDKLLADGFSAFYARSVER